MKRLLVLCVGLLAVGCGGEATPKPDEPSAGSAVKPQAQQKAAAEGVTQAVSQAMPVDIEESDEPFLSGMGGEPVEPFEGMSLQEFEAAWKIDLDAADRPAGEVLQKLVEELGLSLDRGGSDEALAKPIRVKLTGCSRLQAVEEVCRLAGLYPSYQEPDPSKALFSFDSKPGEKPPAVTVTLKPGPRPQPAVFVGPLSIEVSGVETFPPHATGTLKLAIRTFALPSSLKHFLEEEGDAELALEQVSGPDGQDLWDASRTSTDWNFPLVPLKNLLRGLESVGTVRGELRIPVPTRVENLEFDKLQADVSQEAGGVQVTLQQVEREERCELRFSVGNLDADQITWQALDAQGNELEVGGTGSFFFGNRGQIEITVEGRPASLVASVVGGRGSMRFDKVEAGLGGDVGGGRIALARVENRESYNLSFRAKGAQSVQLVPRDDQGNPIPVQWQGGGGFGGEVEATLNVEGRLASVTANCVVAVEEVTYGLELKNIPLGSLEAMPEKLEPLEFAGHEAPVTVEFLKFVPDEHFPDHKNLRLRATNHSNKDIRRMEMTEVYLDGDGKKLDDFPASHAGALDFQTGDLATAVVKGATAELDVSAHFMPEETKSASINLRSVEFADGTAWEPD